MRSVSVPVVALVGVLMGGIVASAAEGTGRIDLSFADDGIAVADLGSSDDTVHGVVVDPSGAITIVGEAREDDRTLRSFALARFTPDGRLDPDFGEGGLVHHQVGEVQGSGAWAAALQSDGRIVAAGYARDPAAFHDTFAVARYEANGTIDASFGDGGRVLTAIDPQTGAGRYDIAHAVALDAAGRIVVAGETTSGAFMDFGIARYLPDGSLDPTFGDGGIVVTDLGGDDRANAIAVQPDGAIVVAGSGWREGPDEDFALVRYGPDGAIDPAFGDGGIVTIDFRGGADRAFGVAVRPDGAIVLGGVAQLSGGCSPNPCERYGFGVAQVGADGTLDTSFGEGGLLHPDFVASSGGYALALFDDGTAAIAGHIGNEDFGLMFVDRAGAPIPVEGGDALYVDIRGASDRAFAIAPAPQGAVVLAGDSSDGSIAFDAAVVRYLAPTAQR